MFYFHHDDQSIESDGQFRSLLFEDLLRRYLEATGYAVQIRRARHSALEWDLHGSHTINDRVIVGEAKAHEDTIGSDKISAFVGKFTPAHFADKKASGLFLSTSALSPEAEDFLKQLRATTPFDIVAHSGHALENAMRSALSLSSHDAVTPAVARILPIATGQHLLHTNRGTFILVRGSEREDRVDDRFAILGPQGTTVDDTTFLNTLRRGIDALQELEPVYSTTRAGAKPARREIPSGLVTSTDWLDYRRPAGADHFVGRIAELQRTAEIIEGASGSVVEVKSRSGVGKSSLLAVLAKQHEASGVLGSSVVDGRTAQSAHAGG